DRRDNDLSHGLLPGINERGGAIDLHDVHLGADRDYQRLVVGTRGPLLAADTNPPAVLGDLLRDDRRAADERRGSRTQRRRLLEVTYRDRPDEAEPGRGRDDERG